MKKKTRKMCGVGINDADYPVVMHDCSGSGSPVVIWACPFYTKWSNMIKRCYSKSMLKNNPTYKDVTVCDEWHYFSNFKAWMEEQDWSGMQLDKDFLSGGEKIYSPETCVFIPKLINTFTLDRARDRGELPLGVNNHKGMMRAKVKNPISGKHEHLGLFYCPLEAHMTWRARKHEIAHQLADIKLSKDERVNQRLRHMYK